MKKAFTLIELLIVVVVLVTLMTITFRLGAIGQSQSERNTTVNRIQRLENCLSGYYAAFGTYPPVRLHGSRNYKLKVSSHGIQNMDGEEQNLHWDWFNADKRSVKDSKNEAADWEMVQAACKAQPVDCRFPFPENGGYDRIIEAMAENLKSLAEESDSISEERKKALTSPIDDGVSKNRGRHDMDKSEWRDVQLFKFGLMSFLLPRYLVMMGSAREFYEDSNQWSGNNAMPCDPLTGRSFNTWSAMRDKANSDQQTDLASIANIPSQAACARWIPNLENSCHCNYPFSLFGINIQDGTGSDLAVNNLDIEIFSPGGFDDDSTSGQYVLDGVTVRDGWHREFYYYCPAPYQSYVLWSAGANGRTFPPWVSRKELDSSANECVGYWTEDDIVNLSH